MKIIITVNPLLRDYLTICSRLWNGTPSQPPVDRSAVGGRRVVRLANTLDIANGEILKFNRSSARPGQDIGGDAAERDAERRARRARRALTRG